MAVTQYSKSTWYPIRSGHECPVCNSKKGRCSFMENEEGKVVMYRCKYAESNRPSTDGWYIHLANELIGDTTIKINEIKSSEYNYEPITDELLTLWDKIYRKFQKSIVQISNTDLYSDHKKNLLNRGLDEDTLASIGCFSIPKNIKVTYDYYTCSLKTAVVNELLKSFKPEALLRVPGFQKIKANGKEFITFKNSLYNKINKRFEDIDGYFIPYYDYKNRLVGMQYRLMQPLYDDKGKLIRYLWYASKEISCGSPIDYHVPQKLQLDDVILITEGALKAKIASEIIGVCSLAEAGVSNYRKLITELQLLEKQENKKYKILLALDMDKYTNPDVIAAEINTVSMLKALGYSITIIEWDINEGKGIDDKLKISSNGFRFLTV
ncbi:TPA: DUF3854 domain-containing protein [Clostridium botulinum]|uniref:DUF3854 domain-containing protein n=1 Tax=Clostridium botulinum TaxID=1491 RepID=A0A126JJE5_CLOBO|nr:DUF3854 domain-containing protein [Clostridium botulinum]ALT05697.1 topoisomerase-primase domain-containing hypothetical protein [Clostridium botulinum]ALT05799.1 topoisomerase-primase domain-containing hypothetical protein [Clostridium botulinum]ALT05909.1 topoisomerase-primase domain-containing hypothetical protein [Clostridium botulinum]HBJ2623118.1 DUF3854 domain-containing protein [Clostridium botulinum]